MKNLLVIIILTVTLIFLFFPLAWALDIAVIGNGVPSEEITEKTLERIFLKRKTRWKLGGRIVPLNLPSQSELRGFFSERILKRSHRELVEYWNIQHFKGKNPPLVLESEEAVKIFVREVEGAIGYIRAENLDPDLEVLFTISVEGYR